MTRFSMINRKNGDGYNPRYQRHHLIPLQAASMPEVRGPLDEIAGAGRIRGRIRGEGKDERSGSYGFDFDNFETNGVLLPSDEAMALKTGHPLHRGPHPRYNKLVIERLRLIIRLSNGIENRIQRRVFFRLRMKLLQSTLRRALVGSPLPVFRLNKRDPGLSSSAFIGLDSCVDALYMATRWPPLRGE